MSGPSDRANRSVADFSSTDEVRRALRTMDIKTSPSEGQYISFAQPGIDASQIGDSNTQREEDTASVSVSSGGTGMLDEELDWVLENYDTEITEAQTLREELKRLLVLKSYLVLDSERQESFERVTGLASRIFKCPIALISLVDLGRQWFMSNRGLGDTRETSRKLAFCAHAIMGKEDVLIVPDATKDWRFKENPLVTGAPFIRFYAGAPLITPEGYKLGTLCVLDRVARPNGLTLEEKQNIMELSSLAVQALVDHKRQKTEDFNDPAQLIAYTAHDLLTPLTGVQLSLGLLGEDEEFNVKLTQQQREILSTAANCADVMGRICQSAIGSFREQTQRKQQSAKKQGKAALTSTVSTEPVPLNISDFVKSLYMVLDPYPKRVPMIITVHSSIPEAIITDDLKVFRSAVNYLTNACAKTEKGSVHLSITTVNENGSKQLLFECEDTGAGVPVEKYPYLFRPFKADSEEYSPACINPNADGSVDLVSRIQMPNSGLGLYSVAVHISSIGGQYGFRPREGNDHTQTTGSIFWFRIPLVLPDSEASAQINMIHDHNSLKSSLRELSDDIRPGKNVTVVTSSPILSESDATKVYNTFTRVLEDGVSESLPHIVETVKEVKITEEAGKKDTTTQPASNTQEAIPSKEEFAKAAEGEKRQRRALVIEDSLVVRKSLTRVLTKLGFEAVQAVDGMEGLKELQCSLFDVVLCDFLMPVMDGLDCVQQYREWEKVHRPFFKQYIIGISAHASDQDVAKGMEVGMNDFKPKPVTYKQLAELSKTRSLKVYSDQLDEIGARGTLRMKTDDQGNGESNISGNGTTNTDKKSQNSSTGNTSIHFCLIAVEKKTSEIAAVEKAAQSKGWKSVIVHNGEEVLKLMKLRNWDVILLDEDLPIISSTQCVSRFRGWELKNRVNRQRHVVLLSASCVSMYGSKSMVQLPFGFDASLGKPVRMNEFEEVMSSAERAATDFGVRDGIVSR